MTNPFHSLSLRLATAVGLAFALGLALHFYLSMSHHETALLKLKKEEANLLSDTIKDSLSHAMEQGQAGRDAIHRVIEEVGHRDEIERVRVFNAVGLIQYSSDSSEMGKAVDKETENCQQCHSTDPPLRPSHITDRDRFFYTPARPGASGYRVMGVINPIYNDPEQNCNVCHQDKTVLGVLDVVVSLRTLDEEIAGHRRTLVLMSVLGALVLVGVVWLFVHFIVHRPVSALVEGARKVRQLDLDHRIPADRKDVLGTLARAFNSMTARLKDAQAELREFADRLEEKVEEKTIQLESAARLAVRTEKMAAIGQMAAGVAHEINNPLTGVITFAHLLRRKFPEGTQDREDIDTIIEEARRCSKIARDLLEFSRPGELVRREVVISELLDRTLAVLEHQPSFHNIEVIRRYDPDVPRILADRDRIQQVFLNLILNAAEAMDGDGTLTLRTSGIPAENAVRIEVEDTGPGIPGDIRTRIFDPFFTTKEVGSGTGLGLSVSFRLVEDHGGRILIAETSGRGTRFAVVLPAAGAEEEA